MGLPSCLGIGHLTVCRAQERDHAGLSLDALPEVVWTVRYAKNKASVLSKKRFVSPASNQSLLEEREDQGPPPDVRLQFGK